MAVQKVTVYGAGIAGLVAAINLANMGFKVEVAEKRDGVGGSTTWHPSIHQQSFDLNKTSNFIGIDIIPCFHPVKRQVLYIYDRKITLNNLKNNWVCEKGQKTTSIENYLYSKARECKIEFKFGEIFDLSQIRIEKTDEPKCIVATGLEKELYAELEIRQVVIKGCRGRQLK